MITEPLLQLIQGNISDAKQIGMIDCSDPAINQYIDKTSAEWLADATMDPVDKYDHYMLAAEKKLANAYKPRQAFTGKTITITRVCPFFRLVAWLEKLIPPPDFEKYAHLKDLQDKRHKEPDAEKHASDGCMSINAYLEPGRGKLTRAQDITFDRLFWVGRINHDGLSRKASYWRDRLGLVHINPGTNSKISELLVRAEFQVTLSKSILQPKTWLQQLNKEPKGLWLVRPSVTHRGNQRWMQSYASDRFGDVIRKHGRTRDIGSVSFEGFEPELLLLSGEDAKIRFCSVELLEGLPYEDSKRNNSDSHFVAAMKTERQWA